MPATSDIQQLCADVVKHVKSLPYDSDYYMPMNRKGIFEYFITHDYLRAIGFKSTKSCDTSYVREADTIYGGKTGKIVISFKGLDPMGDFMDRSDTLSDTIQIFLHNGDYSWVETKVPREVEAIKAGIDGLLKPLLLTNAANDVATADKLSTQNVDALLHELDKNMSLVSSKVEMKKKLQAFVDAL